MVKDYGLIGGMQEIAISKFKATCLSVLENVRRTGTPIRITRFGKPIAEIIPPSPQRSASWLGSMSGEVEIVGDIVSPIGALKNWKVDHK